MPQSNGDRRYSKANAERYIKYLCCWTFANEVDAAKRRDSNDYKEMLLKVIEANKSRNDKEGKWEVEFAKRELILLRKQAKCVTK